jgi:hypothetical protein
MRPVKGHLIAGNSWIGRHDGRATRGRSIDDDEWITPAVHPHNQVCSLSKHAHGTPNGIGTTVTLVAPFIPKTREKTFLVGWETLRD